MLNVFIAITTLLAATTPTLALAKVGHFNESINAQTFYRGNIHTHTSESDGNAPPSTVLNWFKSNGYQFVAITDHDKLTVTPPNISDQNFVTINGVEVTGRAVSRGVGGKPVHVNALCGTKAAAGVRNTDPVLKNIKDNLQAARADGSITLLNHPNFGWAISRADLRATTGFDLLEIASGHPEVNDGGDKNRPLTRPSAVKLWDEYMTTVGRVFGAAVDDSHHYFKFDPKNINPGRAWIAVWAKTLSADDICAAIRSGHFYSSKDFSPQLNNRALSGVNILSLKIESQSIELSVANWSQGDRVKFIGTNGKLLHETKTNPARYALRGDEKYVRAQIEQGSAKTKRVAWTQAYFVSYE